MLVLSAWQAEQFTNRPPAGAGWTPGSQGPRNSPVHIQTGGSPVGRFVREGARTPACCSAFATVDYWIVAVYVLVATLPGLLCRKYVRGQDDFLIAGRSLSVYLATATLTATEMGLVTVVYMAQIGFVNGLSGMVLGLIAAGATVAVGLTGFMVSGLRASGATTVAEYYQKRYSTGVRLLGGLIIATAGIMNYGMFLRPEAEFVRTITGMHDLEIAAVGVPGAVPLFISSIKLTMVVMIGLGAALHDAGAAWWSVTLTNYVRFVLLSIGMALVTLVGVRAAGCRRIQGDCGGGEGTSAGDTG